MTNNQALRTGVYAAFALVMMLLAWATQPRVSRDSTVFDDTREPFYPLTDASVPKALEIVEFNEALGQASPFRVHFKDGRWSIPSHYDYPADAEDRLKRTAGAIIGLRKDSIVSDSKDDHADLGVADPFESGSGDRGWGTRVKLFDKDNNLVTDLIIGKDVKDRQGFKYVRVPGYDRVYAVECKNLDLSTKMKDWIDTNLLQLSSFDLDRIVLKDYTVDVSRGEIRDRGTTTLLKNSQNEWTAEGLKENEGLDTDKARDLASAIGDLRIDGVRPKPPGLQPDLRIAEGVQLARSMQERGFYPYKGSLVSNEGEVLVTTRDGLVYTLRFGKLLVGTGLDITAGKEDEKGVDSTEATKKEEKDSSKLQESRFLLVTVSFDESKFPPIEEPAAKPVSNPADPKAADKSTKAEVKDAKAKETKDSKDAKKADDEAKKKQDEELKQKREERQKKIDEGKKKAKELTDRFAQWYYVIPNDSFKKIRLSRADLIKDKKELNKNATGATPAAPPTPTPPVPSTTDEKSAKAKEDATTKPAETKGSATTKPAAETKAPSKKDEKVEPKPSPSKAEPKPESKPAPAKAEPKASDSTKSNSKKAASKTPETKKSSET